MTDESPDSIRPPFNEAARTEEQKQLAEITRDERRQNLLVKIREESDRYLRRSEQTEREQKEGYAQAVTAEYGRLLKEQGYPLELTPPGVVRNLMATAQNNVTQEYARQREDLRRGYEDDVCNQINEAVAADRMEQRLESYIRDRNTWLRQHMNTLERIDNAPTDAEKLHFGQALEMLDRGWSRTIDRYMEVRTQERDRGLTPDWNGRAHDVGPSR